MHKEHFKKYILLFAFSFLLSSCNQEIIPYDDKDDEVTVIVVENEHCELLSNDKSTSNLSVATFKKGENVTFSIRAEENYKLASINYENSSIYKQSEESNIYFFELYEVKNSFRCNLNLQYVNPDSIVWQEHTITYNPNGGELTKTTNKGTYNVAHHPRPNVSIGTNIMKRAGYNLIGWNSKADLSGTHVGLGSRYIDEINMDFTLYAEWSKYTEPSHFSIEKISETTVGIKEYLNDEEEVSIPQIIDGKNVIKISTGAFKNKTAKKIIFPKTIETVEESAFENCVFKEIYLYDNIVNIGDSSFKNNENFATVHINAIEKPRFARAYKHAPYADKIDLLYMNRNKKKIIIQGGSGAYYNLDACYLKEKYPDYEPINVAINGWFNGVMQFEIVNKFLNKDDVFLHCVESCGDYQLMKKIDMGEYDEIQGNDYRYFSCLELNYDLISYADIRKVSSFFDTFKMFNDGRESLPATSYKDFTRYADNRGDFSKDEKLRQKLTPHENGAISNEGKIDLECYSALSLSKLSTYYENMVNLGIKVFFLYCPLNRNSLTEEELNEEHINAFTSGLVNGLSTYANFLYDFNEILYDVTYFSDSDWHLDYGSALKYSEMVWSKLKENGV